MGKYIVEVYEDRTVWFNEAVQFHRLDGPAIEYNNGRKSWWVNGQLHRTDGPAIESADGGKSWFVNGEFHRTDGPAEELKDGSKFWYQNGLRHRTDGPAIEWSNGDKMWWINGEQLTEKEFNNRNKPCSGKKVVVDGVEYTLS
jgi:hypothetical protein